MITFFFYLSGILIVFTLVAALADFSLWIQERKQASAGRSSGEAMTPDGEKVT